MKRKANKVLIGVRLPEDAAKEAIRAWKRAERGEPVEKPVDRVYFTDENTLFKTLSTKRRELLRFLRHKSGAVSIKQLTERIGRDYKNVHSDVKLLGRLGLIQCDKDKKVFVPWDNIALEIALAA